MDYSQFHRLISLVWICILFSDLGYAGDFGLLTGSPNTLSTTLLEMETEASKLGL